MIGVCYPDKGIVYPDCCVDVFAVYLRHRKKRKIFCKYKLKSLFSIAYCKGEQCLQTAITPFSWNLFYLCWEMDILYI